MESESSSSFGDGHRGGEAAESASPSNAIYGGSREELYLSDDLLAESVTPPAQYPLRDIIPRRLVIGIDFGTTHTSVAYALPRGLTTNTLENDVQVTVISDWNPRMRNIEKVPSVISYTPSSGGHEQWGTDLSDDAVTYTNMKLELAVQPTMLDELELTWHALEMSGFLSFEHVRRSHRDSILAASKTPEDAVRDYMGNVVRSLQRDSTFARASRQFATDIVITIPADWSYNAKNSIFRAYQKAGVNISTFPQLDQIIFLSEPEAASIYATRRLREGRGESELKLNECFILCKAGGFTVQGCYRISSHAVTTASRVETSCTSEQQGGKCGAMFINQSFKRWLRRVIGYEYYIMLDPEGKYRSMNESVRSTDSIALRELMSRFETLRNIFSHRSGLMYIDLPAPLENLNMPPRIDQGQLAISSEDMKSVFDPCVNGILDLIQSQVLQAERIHRRVRSIFLIGGFGDSPYLQEELKQSLDLRRISLRRPETRSHTAVAQGAVMYGIEKSFRKSLTTGTPSPQSYGIAVDETVALHKFDPRDLRKDEIGGGDLATLQFAWLVRRGDLILSNEKLVAQKDFTHRFTASHSKAFQLPIYAYSDVDDDVPTRWATGQHEVARVGNVTIDLSPIWDTHVEQRRNIATGQIYFTIHLSCRMSVTAKLLEIDVLANKYRVGRSEIATPQSDRPSGSDYGDW